jgi:hypothetical protein
MGAGGRDASGDCGADASARCPFPLCGQITLQSPLVFYFTRDAEIVSLVGHNASPWYGWLETGR